MSQRLEDKIAIITGAASGIGAATAKRFVAEGANIIMVDTNSDKLATVSNEIDQAEHVRAIVADVQDESAVADSVKMAVDLWGQVDILINNAGIGSNMSLLDFTREDFDLILGVNLRGPLLFCKHTIPAMRGGGSIVNVASISSTSGIPGQALYGPSKGAIAQMTRQLAIEYAAQHIRVNAVAPGTIETPMLQEAGDPEEMKPILAWLREKHPIGRFGQPEEVSNAILFLASDEASFITGANLAVDGGYTAQ